MSPIRRASLVRASALLVGLTGLSQLLGFVRDAVIAAVFGVSAEVDAYLVAQGVMNLVLGLAAGAMSKALVPTVARAVDDGLTPAAHRTVRVVLTVTTAVLVGGSALMYVAAEGLVAVLAPGFSPELTAQAARLTRIVLVATVFVAGTNILAAAAGAHGRFFWAGVQGVPFNLVMIAAAALLGARFGIGALAAGFVAGSAARFLTQLPAARRVGLRLRPSLRLRDPGFREVVSLVPALLVGSAIVNVNTLVDRAIGSTQGPGTIAALSYGWRIVSLAEVLLVAAFAAVLYPAFSALGQPERRAELRSATTRVIGVVLVLMGPVIVVLTVAARPIVVLVFARGTFDARAVELAALAVSTYAIALAGLAVREITVRASLAVGDSRTPVQTAVVAMLVNVAGDLTLGPRYGLAGLALSTSLSVLVGAVLLVVLTARRHRAAGLGPVARSALAVLVAGAVSAAAAWAVLRVLPAQRTGEAALALLAGAGTTAVTYTAVLVLLRVPAIADVGDSLRHLFRRSDAARTRTAKT
ncbi:murein biosynthesis integral membrane protein MurJ [Streptomyces sp. SBT349]|uniref:murein biosynthesis integral membrane protein MurJ n=1 Tax=Streptomyces sp. SBT349 TaxID=1580539 RepID=UPI00066EB36D|nr:murein biosynthesis integral membrane protein MurJ [Streptomyces sp. SBT349]